ncbi:MAG: DedA family protein [Thermoleophilia bacterium]
MIASISDRVVQLVGDHGVYAVFALMAVDAVFPAFSEGVLIYAGALAAGVFAGQHVVVFGYSIGPGVGALAVMGLAATFGYLVGSLVGWMAGASAGRALVERHGHFLHLGAERFAQAERWFDRWGATAAGMGRVVPLVRSFISVPAGVFGQPLVPYTALTLLGSAIWSFALCSAGYAVGSNWESVQRHFRALDYVVIAVVVAAAGLYLLQRIGSSRRA